MNAIPESVLLKRNMSRHGKIETATTFRSTASKPTTVIEFIWRPPTDSRVAVRISRAVVVQRKHCVFEEVVIGNHGDRSDELVQLDGFEAGLPQVGMDTRQGPSKNDFGKTFLGKTKLHMIEVSC